MPKNLNFEPSTLEMESVTPPVKGIQSHHVVLFMKEFNFANNTRDVDSNLFPSAAAAEKARRYKADVGYGKGTIASENYLKESEVVFLNDGDKVPVGNTVMTHKGDTLV